MKRLIVTKKEEYGVYYLEDKNNNEYRIIMNFYDIDKDKIGIGTIFYFKESLIYKLNNHKAYFEPLESNSGILITDSSDENIIVVIIDNKEVFLKRAFG